MKVAIPLTVVLLGMVSAVVIMAETRVYTWNKDKKKYRVEGVVPGDEGAPPIAIYCKDSVCKTTDVCGYCHSQPADVTRYASDREIKHQRIYFPKAALRLGEGQKVKFGLLVVTRSSGVLVVQDLNGQRFELPPDAYVVTGRDGQPAFIVSGGVTEPQLSR